MSKESERVFRELQKAMAGNNFENDDQANEFISNFMQEYNNKVGKNRQPDSYDYLEMAENAITEEEAVKYAQKALKLDPYCLDAEMIIAQTKSDTIDELKKNIEKVINKGELQLSERGISKEANAGDFYGILETRPYMRIRKSYLELLIEQGRFRSAVMEAEELLHLCENDNLGVRYTLMALYSYFEDEDKALELIQKYKEDSAFMVLPLIALYYKKDDSKKMRSYITKLKKRNPDIQEALDIIMSGNEDEIFEITSAGMYRPFSMEEVVLAIVECQYLYMTMPHFLMRLYDEV